MIDEKDVPEHERWILKLPLFNFNVKCVKCGSCMGQPRLEMSSGGSVFNRECYCGHKWQERTLDMETVQEVAEKSKKVEEFAKRVEEDRMKSDSNYHEMRRRLGL